MRLYTCKWRGYISLEFVTPCTIFSAQERKRGSVLLRILLLQDLKAQLEELDVETQSIDSHVSSLVSATPSGEDEVRIYTVSEHLLWKKTRLLLRSLWSHTYIPIPYDLILPYPIPHDSILHSTQGLEGDDDLTIFCATCGQPTGIKKAIHHMERCFSKVNDCFPCRVDIQFYFRGILWERDFEAVRSDKPAKFLSQIHIGSGAFRENFNVFFEEMGI